MVARNGRRSADRGLLAARDIAAIDCPVSGGVAGAETGILALMVSGPRPQFELLRPVLEAIGRPMHVGEQPGAAQTMKLVNNILAATVLIASSEVMVMGTKAGLDPTAMIDVLNAGSGATSASRDKFPRAILPRTFDSGFATGLMVKDVRLYLDEARALGVPVEDRRSRRATLGNHVDRRGRRLGFHLGDQADRTGRGCHCRRPTKGRMILSSAKNTAYGGYPRFRHLPGPMFNRNAYRKPIE